MSDCLFYLNRENVLRRNALCALFWRFQRLTILKRRCCMYCCKTAPCIPKRLNGNIFAFVILRFVIPTIIVCYLRIFLLVCFTHLLQVCKLLCATINYFNQTTLYSTVHKRLNANESEYDSISSIIL